ncbi:MAG: nicotinamide riboside transporter PnuC [Bacteroidota bacterium]
MEWLIEHGVEIAGVVFSLLYLWFSIRRNILLWPVGIISAVLYVLVFYKSRFYADMSLNVYYFFISIYGWILWSRKGRGEEAALTVTRAGNRLNLLLGIISLLLFLSGGYILSRFTDSPLPYWDAFTTALSITATWMLTRKIIGHWLLWIVVDLVSLGLYLYRGLYPTAVLFLVYSVMAVTGYFEWKKVLDSKTGEA